MHSFCLLLLVALAAHAGAFDLGQTTRCVPVPHQMSVCQDVPYSEMRLPNLLGHSSLEEAVPRSDDWRTLLHTGCHPQARAFVCSLVAPVCLDRDSRRSDCVFRLNSLVVAVCMAVKESCAPVLACHGHAWPEALNCDRFPAQDDTCLTPLPKHISAFSK
ncbi:hypothetical protein M9458_049829, partial [Cirrhinus mrigala]